MTTQSSHKVSLYGGAVTVELPTSLIDASDLREIPDNQEVFLGRDTLTSTIFDILQRAEQPDHPCTTDDEALSYHFKDVVEAAAGDEETKEWKRQQVQIPNLPEAPALAVMASQHHKTSGDSDRSQTPDFTVILMTLVRLVKQKTDIVITINVPHAAGEYRAEEIDLTQGKLGPLVTAALQQQEGIWRTFSIEDWGLFSPDETPP